MIQNNTLFLMISKIRLKSNLSTKDFQGGSVLGETLQTGVLIQNLFHMWEYFWEPARVYSLSRSENVSMTCVIRLPTLKHVGFSLLHKRQCIVSLRLDYLYQTLLLSDIFSPFRTALLASQSA